MNRYLYFFAYETPQQLVDNKLHRWDAENSHAFYVVAGTEHEALVWGQEVAEAFFSELHQQSFQSWKALGYADGIDNSMTSEITSEAAQKLPVVRVGQFPSWPAE